MMQSGGEIATKAGASWLCY